LTEEVIARDTRTLLKERASLAKIEEDLDTHRTRMSKFVVLDRQRDALSAVAQMREPNRKRITANDAKITANDARITETREEQPDTSHLTTAEQALKSALTSLEKSRERERWLWEESALLDFWITGFGKKGVRSYLLDHIANDLNRYAARYAQYLTDGEIEVVFSTQRQLASGEMAEDFQIQGLNRHGADVYKGNSVGERQRVNTCVALALQDFIRNALNVSTNLFIVDEATANLDGEGSERMLRLLSDLAKGERSVFYITHDPRAKDLFTHRLKVIKENGVSRVDRGEEHAAGLERRDPVSATV